MFIREGRHETTNKHKIRLVTVLSFVLSRYINHARTTLSSTLDKTFVKKKNCKKNSMQNIQYKTQTLVRLRDTRNTHDNIKINL